MISPPPRPSRDPAAPAAEGWVAVEQVQAEAERLGVATRLRRWTAQGLLAAPCSTGRGRARGRHYVYPIRALDQLVSIAEATTHGHRYAAIRHRVWWTPGGLLEDWERWREDRLGELRGIASAWEMPPAVDGDPSPERDAHVTAVVEARGRWRFPGSRRPRWRRDDDRALHARLFTSMLLRDDLVEPGTPEEVWARLPRLAGEDIDRSVPEGGTLGELFERGVAWPHPPRDGVARGLDALAGAFFLPTPQRAITILTAVTEERATELRDLVIAEAASAGFGNLLRNQPLVAAQSLATFEEVLAAASQRADSVSGS